MPTKPSKSKHAPPPTGSHKYAFWFKDDTMAVLEALKAQTGMTKSQLMRDLVMALGAGVPIHHMPATEPVAEALAYWKHREAVAAGKADP